MYWVFTESQLEKALSKDGEEMVMLEEGIPEIDTDIQKQIIRTFLFSDEAKKLRGGKK